MNNLAHLSVPAIYDRTLAHAVWADNPDHAPRYARVLLARDSPRVRRAIVEHGTSISMTEASLTGRVNVLRIWKWSGKLLVVDWQAIELNKVKHFGVLDWWRRSGLVAKRALRSVDQMTRVHFSGA
ncbi:hypothetical protein H9P43_007655 [Blastocladiella emersonii ATCC 22665]|nr:hypothetical protein H9P43_007655 [Blastocladiella emersonii ATCC 22665]